MSEVQGYQQDPRTVDKLINGVNLTTQDKNMWLIPYVYGNDHKLTIDFKEDRIVSGIRIWNYNKSVEDLGRGVQIMNVSADGKLITPSKGLLVRKAPGSDTYDYG